MATLKALTQAASEAEAEAMAADEAVRKARAVVAALPDLGEALAAWRLADARVERTAAEAELAQLERAREQAQAQFKQVARPRVRIATERLSDIDAWLAALADPPEPDRAVLRAIRGK